MTFKPSIGLDGFRVVSTFDINEINCSDLASDVYQLAIVLYPPEVINEKFLIRMRDCVLKLAEEHPLKRWIKWVGESRPLNKKDQAKRDFLIEIINTQFNLITDQKLKNKIINLIDEVPESTIAEQLLKSYLYLMVGNITRSDNILREIITTRPLMNWEKSGLTPSFYHRLSSEHSKQIFSKLARHPADRKALQLFSLYLQSYYNEASLLQLADSVSTSEVEAKIELQFIEALAPELVHFLRIKGMNENKRMAALRNHGLYPLNEQSYWVWPFIDITPLVSEALSPELARLEEEDELWFIYLMDNEKLADIFSRKSGKSFLPKRRPFLKEKLRTPNTFMLGLYKLIELGDINQELVIKTTEQLIHD